MKCIDHFAELWFHLFQWIFCLINSHIERHVNDNYFRVVHFLFVCKFVIVSVVACVVVVCFLILGFCWLKCHFCMLDSCNEFTILLLFFLLLCVTTTKVVCTALNIIFNENIFISFEMFPPRKFIHANNFLEKKFVSEKMSRTHTQNYATKNIAQLYEKSGIFFLFKTKL